MIVEDLLELAQLRKASRTPELPLIRINPAAMMTAIRHQHFPEVPHYVAVWFVPAGPLACIRHDDRQADIWVHSLLNHPAVPEGVFRLIITHELLHLVIGPREVDGRRCVHPPEFVDEERVLVTDRKEIWEWLYLSFHDALRIDVGNERIWVKRNWRQVRRRLD